jgi:hypothetical protein
VWGALVGQSRAGPPPDDRGCCGRGFFVLAPRPCARAELRSLRRSLRARRGNDEDVARRRLCPVNARRHRHAARVGLCHAAHVCRRSGHSAAPVSLTSCRMKRQPARGPCATASVRVRSSSAGLEAEPLPFTNAHVSTILNPVCPGRLGESSAAPGEQPRAVPVASELDAQPAAMANGPRGALSERHLL